MTSPETDAPLLINCFDEALLHVRPRHGRQQRSATARVAELDRLAAEA